MQVLAFSGGQRKEEDLTVALVSAVADARKTSGTYGTETAGETQPLWYHHRHEADAALYVEQVCYLCKADASRTAAIHGISIACMKYRVDR